MTHLALSYVMALGAALVLVPLCRWAALRMGFVATPKADRWHQRQTALLGGVAISMVVLVGAVAAGLTPLLHPLIAGGAGIFVLGLTDDLVGLKPSTKLVAEVALASGFVFFGYRLHWVDSLTLDAMLTLFWIVGVTNAFNLLDNMDGLCAGTGLIVAGALLIASVQAAEPARAEYLVLLMGALSGFLVYNFNPSSIFMGDSGSLFVGLALGTLALSPLAGGRADSGVLSAIAAPVLLLLIPIFDTSLVTVLRLLSGRRPSQGGKDHSSHRLVAIGLRERTAVLVLWALAAVGASIGVSVQAFDAGFWGAAGALFILAMLIFSVYLSQVRVYEAPDLALVHSGSITPFVTAWLYKRRAAEVLLDVCLVALSYYLAYRVRFEGGEYQLYFRRFLISLPLVVAIQMLALFGMGAYRGVWRYFGLMDGVVFGKAVGVATIAIVATLAFLYRLQDYSRGVFLIYASMVMLALTGSRASFRLMSEFIRRRRPGERLVIYGAGDAGALTVRELLSNEHRRYRMLGFIDDDGAKQRSKVHGYPVLGGLDKLVELIESGAVDCVVLSPRVMHEDRLRVLEQLCATSDVALSRLHFRLEELVSP